MDYVCNPSTNEPPNVRNLLTLSSFYDYYSAHHVVLQLVDTSSDVNQVYFDHNQSVI
jgi:hypothetical protein